MKNYWKIKDFLTVLFICLLTIIIYFKDGSKSTVHNGRVKVDGNLVIIYDSKENVDAVIKIDEIFSKVKEV
jgi:hypothetical protein